MNLTAKDSYLSEAKISFNITIFTSRPATISQPLPLCLYQDDPQASLLLASPLPSFATSPPLTYTLSPLSTPMLPPFLPPRAHTRYSCMHETSTGKKHSHTSQFKSGPTGQRWWPGMLAAHRGWSTNTLMMSLKGNIGSGSLSASLTVAHLK